jgi:hypothetical protein
MKSPVKKIKEIKIERENEGLNNAREKNEGLNNAREKNELMSLLCSPRENYRQCARLEEREIDNGVLAVTEGYFFGSGCDWTAVTETPQGLIFSAARTSA